MAAMWASLPEDAHLVAALRSTACLPVPLPSDVQTPPALSFPPQPTHLRLPPVGASQL